MRICDEGAITLACAVLTQAAKDIKRQSVTRSGIAENEVMNGGIDLYLDLIGIDMDANAFIKRAKEERRDNKAMAHAG